MADAEPEPVELHDGTLVVTIVEAAQLKKMDTFGQNDVYCVAAVSGKEKKTKTVYAHEYYRVQFMRASNMYICRYISVMHGTQVRRTR